jgi:hypothetical protein
MQGFNAEHLQEKWAPILKPRGSRWHPRCTQENGNRSSPGEPRKGTPRRA